jgi:hypothetical protein
VSARAENDRGGMVDVMDLLNTKKKLKNNDEDGCGSCINLSYFIPT